MRWLPTTAHDYRNQRCGLGRVLDAMIAITEIVRFILCFALAGGLFVLGAVLASI